MVAPPRLAAAPLLATALAVLLCQGCSNVPPEGRARLERQLPEQSLSLPPADVARAAVHADDRVTCLLVRATGPIVPHRHFHSEEIVYVISGRGVLHLADGDRDVAPGDLIVVPPNTPHGFTPSSEEPVVLLATFVPPLREGDRVPEVER